MTKHLLFFGMLSLNTLASSPFIKEPCPMLDVKANCSQGVWHANLSAPAPWELRGYNINNHACSNEGEQSKMLRWNYAAFHGRVGAICNFSLLDSQGKEIDTVQLMSRSFLTASENWRSGGYPTYKICDLAQEKCQFLKIPE